MSDKPYLKELQDICGSEKLHDCFKFLMIQEIPINEENMRNVAAVRDDMRMNVEKRSDRQDEVFDLYFDEVEAAGDVFDALHEVQIIEKRLVESLASVVADFQRLIALKNETIEKLEEYDED
ncbi:hypothetical protein CTI12_AA127430 [Artemisia annua]|uniref:Uncharacterized protein n=1 Tax=Artemisia annua TaxID=35608 RepID=A0A2U1PPD4_ARTAN|nr:hypothetical protein CTI12_AA127430 [Artemisia annua]